MLRALSNAVAEYRIPNAKACIAVSTLKATKATTLAMLKKLPTSVHLLYIIRFSNHFLVYSLAPRSLIQDLAALIFRTSCFEYAEESAHPTKGSAESPALK